MTFLTQLLGLSIFDPNLDSNNPALFRVCNVLGYASNFNFNDIKIT